MSSQSAPKTACTNCGVKKWKRIGFDGTWICIHGHQYLGNEEVGDHEDMLGTQTRMIKTRKIKKDKDRVVTQNKKIKLSPNLILLNFQSRLKDQVEWLVKEKKVDPIIFDVVLQLWVCWVGRKGLGRSKSHFESHKTEEAQDDLGDLEYLCSSLKPSFSLIFISLALFIIKVPITLGDLIRFACTSDSGADTTFPYFNLNGVNNKYTTHTASGGYYAIPSLSELHLYQGSITQTLFAEKKTSDEQSNFVDNISISFSLSQPALVLRLFEGLELSIELYLYYKTISGIYGCRVVTNKNPVVSYLHMSACCLWIARLYHCILDENDCEITIAPRKTPASFLFMPDKVSSELYTPFTANSFPHIPLKKTDSRRQRRTARKRNRKEDYGKIKSNKIVEYLTKNFVLRECDRDPLAQNSNHDHFFYSQEKYRQFKENFIKNIKEKGNNEELFRNTVVKSYLTYPIDLNGAKSAKYSYLLNQTSGIIGIENDKVEKELRKLDLVLHYYSINSNASINEDDS